MLTRAVLFDFGGVLLRQDNDDARRAWAERLNFELEDLEARVFESEIAWQAMRGDVPVERFWQAVAADLGLPAEQVAQFREEFFAGDVINEDLLAFARSLRPNYKLAILSNAWSDAREIFTDLLGLDDVFDTLIISAEVGLAKPDPRIYQLAVERLGVEPREAVFLDDQKRNVVAAREFGLRAVHFQDNRQAITEIEGQLGIA
jgi:putative hydrolase of the HAD superfamily